MRRLFTLLLAVVLVVPVCALRAQDDPADAPAPAPPETFPSAYKDDEILPGSISPDGKCGLIFPKRDLLLDMEHPELLLVALKPFRVLTKIPVRYGDLWHGHSSHEVHWTKDSLAVVMNEGSKWGVERVYLVPVHEGQVGKIVDLTAEVENLVRPGFRKSRAVRFNEYYDFIFEDDNGGTWTPDDQGHVVISTTCTTDPKRLDRHSWTVRFQGTWDIATSRFSEKKVVHVPPPTAKELSDR